MIGTNTTYSIPFLVLRDKTKFQGWREWRLHIFGVLEKYIGINRIWDFEEAVSQEDEKVIKPSMLDHCSREEGTSHLTLWPAPVKAIQQITCFNKLAQQQKHLCVTSFGQGV